MLASTALVAATAVLVAARLADGSLVQLLVGAYTIAFAEVVLVSLALSIGANLNRSTLLVSLSGIFLVAVFFSRGVRFPSVRTAASTLAAGLCDPLVAVAGFIVIGVLAYSAALALFTPENVADALGYHLTRAAFWRQQEGIGHIDGALDTRLDGFPPNGEIAMLFTLIASASGRFAGLVQLAATVAALLAVYGIARRIGLDVRASLFGALLLCTLTVVALQASAALNDVIVASLVAASVFFLLGATRSNLLLAGIAVAVLIGTKVTGLFVLPVLAVIAFRTRSGRRLATLCVVAAAAGVGAYWYVFNLVREGDPTGGNAYQRAEFDPVAIVSRITRLILASIELPGAPGLDRLLYVAAAGLVAGLMLLGDRPFKQRGGRALVAAGVVLAPLAAVGVGRLLVRAYLKVFDVLGRTDVGSLDPNRSTSKASPIFSWYGPLGVMLTLLSLFLVYRAVRRGTINPLALLLATAPVIWIVFLGIAVPYYEWNGRYTMGGFALATATWGAVHRLRTVAWGAVAVAALSSALAFDHLHDKAAGIRLLEPVHERSVWTQPDWMIRGEGPHMRALLRFVDTHVPGDVRLAIAPIRIPGPGYRGGHVQPFPFFGDDLSRTLVFATSARRAYEAGAQWAILHRTRGCEPGWQRAYVYVGWMVLRRQSGSGPTHRCRPAASPHALASAR